MALPQTFLSGNGDRQQALIVVFLRGGADTMNLVVPYADDHYYRARPTLGIKADTAIKLTDRYGLHPELKALLPDSIGTMKRTSAEGEKGGAFGIVVAHAEGRYSGDGGSLDLKITDPGTLTGFAAMAAMWMNMELDKETDTGYEKTGTANGRRFHERYDKNSKSGEYTVIVGNRFMVEINGNGTDMPTMKKAIDQVNFAKLEAMKDVGIKK